MNYFNHKKNLYFLLALVIVSISLAIIINNNITNEKSKNKIPNTYIDTKNELTPEQVVRRYYNTWSSFDFEKQYSLIADSFKQQEPSALTLEKFSAFMTTFFGTGQKIEVLETSQTYFDGRHSKIGYRIRVNFQDKQEIESGVHFLELTKDGWKLVAPYGSTPKPVW
jgi:hypothetical protein